MRIFGQTGPGPISNGMKFILGYKQEMTQLFDEKGVARAGTVLRVPSAVVLQVKTKESDGYAAVQIGTGTKKEKNITKAQKGHFKNFGVFGTVREFRLPTPDRAGGQAGTDDVSAYAPGAAIDLSQFAPGDKIVVSATSKGKGFQGVVKRHGFHGGPRSHGQKHSEREPGSIGGGLRTRVPAGMRMGGRMGGDRVTVKNLTVLAVDPESNTMVVSGAVPGRRGTLVEIRGN